MDRGVPHHAAPPQTLAARLELRLDEDQSRSVRGQKRVDRRKDEGQGDEGGVADGEADRLVEVGGGQVPGASGPRAGQTQGPLSRQAIAGKAQAG